MQRFSEADLAATESVEIDQELEEILRDGFVSSEETIRLAELRREVTYPHVERMQGVAECCRLVVRLVRVGKPDRNVIARLTQYERWQRERERDRDRQRKVARTAEILATEQRREAA